MKKRNERMKKWIKRNKVFIIIFLLALIIRMIFIIKYPLSKAQHDVNGENGHFSYIQTIFIQNRLPSTNQYQYYQPPLHHFISAMWLKVFSKLIRSYTTLIESLQFVPLIYSMLLLIVINKILKELKIKDKYKNLILVIMAFHPTFTILSGSINNDMLSILLIFCTLYELIKWYKKSDMVNTIILAIVTGLAVMAKTSGAIVSLPIMYIFLLQFYRAIKKGDKRKIWQYIGMYCVFGIISLSLGLWYPVRNYILFKQPILYILDPNNQKLYVGDKSLLSRFLPFSKEIFIQYADPYEHYNIPTFLIKSSLFGEWTWTTSYICKYIYVFALFANIAIIVFSIVAIIREMTSNRKRDLIYRNIFLILYFFNIISFISMNIKLPYGCSMDFRYIVPTIFIGIYFIGLQLRKIQNEAKNKLIYRTLMQISIVLVVASNFILLVS